MNYKQLLHSWFGLGLLIFALQYPIWYAFRLFGMADMTSVAIIIAGVTASMIFTQYITTHAMSRSFKIKAIATYFGLSMPVTLTAFLFNSAVMAQFKAMFASLEGSEGFMVAAAGLAAFLFAIGLQAVCLYFLIGSLNKQILTELEKKSAKK